MDQDLNPGLQEEKNVTWPSDLSGRRSRKRKSRRPGLEKFWLGPVIRLGDAVGNAALRRTSGCWVQILIQARILVLNQQYKSTLTERWNRT